MSRPVAVVAHTHWDREWYAPLEGYRARLISVMDQIVELLEDETGFSHFFLDGQMAVVDDYLAARPAQRPRLTRLAQEGRLAAGPWYVLMDEFCVSGETIWRNLELGLSRAEALGCRSFTGYLPDMFGHVSQMPQVLAQAGMTDAVVWRGVPGAIDRIRFWWTAPDGSRVRTEYLPVGYANGAFLPRQAADLVRRVAAHEAEIGGFLPDGHWPILLMNGGDHQAPQAWMPSLLEAANQVQDDYRFAQTSLGEYLASSPADDLPTWSGELRSSARSNLLLGVASNRVDVKQAAAAAERSLERLAEPLCAVWLPPDMWPGELLQPAWLGVIQNSAHDSVCACSADAVVRAVRVRYDAAAALAAEAVDLATAIAEVATEAAGPVVLNSVARDRAGIVEVVVPGTEPPLGAQVLSSTAAAVVSRIGTGADLARLLAELDSGAATDARLTAGPAGVEVVLEQDRSVKARPEMAAVLAEAWAQAGARRDLPLTVRLERAATQRVLVRVPSVPGFGWSVWRPAPLDVPPVTSGPEALSNGEVRVTVDPADGTFGLNDLAGLNRIVDEGDEGDTYTFSPVGPALTDPVRVSVEVVETGPVRGTLRICRWFDWPARLEGRGRAGRERVEVVSDVSICAGDPLVRVTTRFDNRCRDHRVRAVFALPAAVSHSLAECAFGTVRRPADGYGEGQQEVAVPVFPSRRFVQAGPLTVVHDGLLEYELLGGGRALALTLLRAVGVLSRPGPRYRPNAAGPAVAVPDAQLPGPRSFRYALAAGDHDPWQLADAAWTPLVVGRGSGIGRLPPSGRRLTVGGQAQVSSVRRGAGRLEIRLFNPSADAATVELPGHSGCLVDLRGRDLGRWDGSFPIGPWAITTARLDAVSLD